MKKLKGCNALSSQPDGGKWSHPKGAKALRCKEKGVVRLDRLRDAAVSYEESKRGGARQQETSPSSRGATYCKGRESTKKDPRRKAKHKTDEPGGSSSRTKNCRTSSHAQTQTETWHKKETASFAFVFDSLLDDSSSEKHYPHTHAVPCPTPPFPSSSWFSHRHMHTPTKTHARQDGKEEEVEMKQEDRKGKKNEKRRR